MSKEDWNVANIKNTLTFITLFKSKVWQKSINYLNLLHFFVPVSMMLSNFETSWFYAFYVFCAFYAFCACEIL